MQLTEQFLIIKTLTLAEMKSRYRNTFAGLIWVAINPLVQFTVHALIFKYILKIDVDRYFVFLLSGLLPWIYISGTLTQTVHALITNRESLLSYQIHPASIIVAKCIDNLVNFIIPFVFLFALLYSTENYDLRGIMFLPLAVLLLFIGTSLTAILLSLLQVFFRDTQYIINFILSVMFFLTPIFYPRELIPDQYQILVDINPFYAFISSFKTSLWHFSYPEVLASIGYTSVYIFIIAVVTLFTWRRVRNEFYLYI